MDSGVSRAAPASREATRWARLAQSVAVLDPPGGEFSWKHLLNDDGELAGGRVEWVQTRLLDCDAYGSTGFEALEGALALELVA